MGRALAGNPTTSLSAMWGALLTAISTHGRSSPGYPYDPNGNLTSAGNRTFSWSYNNFLTQVSGTGTSTYSYDHAGQRVLYTGQRRSDVVLFGRQHVRQGWLRFTQQKNRNRRPITLELPVFPILQRIIQASKTGELTFLVTEQGQPFTGNGFGNRMREWCDQAGLPHCTAHGLRKAGAAIAAENGATAHELMSIFGWLTLKEAERYTRAAEQKKIAGRAMAMLERGEKRT